MSSKFFRVYRYLAKPASKEDNDRLHSQLHLAGEYRRVLAAIESEERAEVNAIFLENAEIADVDARYKEASQGQADNRAEQLELLGSERSRLRKAYAKTDEFKDRRKTIREKYFGRPKKARGEISAKGLFWGTYNEVEEAHDRARQDTPIWEEIKARGPWHSIMVQLPSNTKHVTGASLFALGDVGSDTRVRVSPSFYPLGPRVDGFQTVGSPGQRNHSGHLRPESFRLLSARIGGEGPGNQTPIWINFHILTGRGGGRGKNSVPRAVPDHARIAWVRVVRTELFYRTVFDQATKTTNIRPHERWEVQFIVEDMAQRSLPTGNGIVSIDIGWRRVEGGIRVGYAMTKRGFSECIIPDQLLTKRDHADSIRSVRDLHMNEVRTEILRLRTAPDTPEWFIETTKSAHLWFRLYHFVELGKLAQQNGWESEFVGALHTWLKKDAHLREYEAGDRRRQRLRIQGRIQAWIAQILDGHDVLAVEKTIRIDLMRSRVTADSESLRQAAVAHTEVSPGKLRVWATQMAVSRGIKVCEIAAHHTTSTCPTCRAIRKVGSALVVKCEACGTEEDQDRSAAREIAKRAVDALQEVLPLEAVPETAPTRSTRRTRKVQTVRVESTPSSEV